MRDPPKAAPATVREKSPRETVPVVIVKTAVVGEVVLWGKATVDASVADASAGRPVKAREMLSGICVVVEPPASSTVTM